jgi:hypothetical protein
MAIIIPSDTLPVFVRGEVRVLAFFFPNDIASDAGLTLRLTLTNTTGSATYYERTLTPADYDATGKEWRFEVDTAQFFQNVPSGVTICRLNVWNLATRSPVHSSMLTIQTVPGQP